MFIGTHSSGVGRGGKTAEPSPTNAASKNAKYAIFPPLSGYKDTGLYACNITRTEIYKQKMNTIWELQNAYKQVFSDSDLRPCSRGTIKTSSVAHVYSKTHLIQHIIIMNFILNIIKYNI